MREPPTAMLTRLRSSTSRSTRPVYASPRRFTMACIIEERPSFASEVRCMARYRYRICTAGSATVLLFLALTHCGSDDSNAGGPTASPDGGFTADGAGGAVDGRGASSNTDEYYQCTSGELEACA